MAAIPATFGTGGSGLTPGGSNEVNLATILRDIADDLANIRTAFVTLTAKIDADSGDTGGDSDYASTCDPAALATTKA